ncbi:MAG: hypothetical protein NVSMB29_02650 [Candidatus Dormibacteria bacterium]
MWGRRRERAKESIFDESEQARVSTLAAAQLGTSPCSFVACTDTTAVPCEYIDRRSHRCGTAWCPQHRIVVDSRVFCRRHAGTVSALPGGPLTGSPLPDLDNRAPSLVSWVAREVDAEIRQLLLSQAGEDGAAQLIVDPVFLIFLGRERKRAWERSWKLVDHRGTALRVALQVEEDDNAAITIKVGSNFVGRVTPPWIAQRLARLPVSAEVDAERRQQFNQDILDIITPAVHREAALDRAASGFAGSLRPPS